MNPPPPPKKNGFSHSNPPQKPKQSQIHAKIFENLISTRSTLKKSKNLRNENEQLQKVTHKLRKGQVSIRND